MNRPPVQDPALSAHLRALRLEEGLAERTVESYARDLAQFATFLGERGRCPVDATADDVRAYLAGGTVAAFHPGPQGCGHPLVLPAEGGAGARRVRSDAGPGEPAPGVDLAADAERGRSRAASRRSRRRPQAVCATGRLLETLYGAGLRASEALGLRLQDVDLEVGFVRTVGKGDKERIVPLGRMAMEAIRAYNERGRPFLGGPGTLKARSCS